jgi:Na+/melibiose symporter-like transporter
MQTGRRQEGVFFAGAAFVAKAVSGIGILSSGLLLAAVDFPQAAVPGHVSLEVLHDLGFVYVIALMVINAFTLVCLTGYPLTRRSHDETIAALAAGLTTESGQ